MNSAIRAHIEELARSIKCSKNLGCITSSFDAPCRARDIGLQNNLVCLEESGLGCGYQMSVAVGQFCQCPVRVYIGKTLNK